VQLEALLLAFLPRDQLRRCAAAPQFLDRFLVRRSFSPAARPIPRGLD